MRISWKGLAVALPLCLAAACSDQPAAPRQVVSNMAKDYMNNLGGGGPWILRGSNQWFAVGWSNDAGTLHVVQTAFPLEYWGAPWDDAACGPPGLFTAPENFQEISHWDPTHTDWNARYFVNALDDSLWVLLLDTAKPGPCLGWAIVASGWGRVHYNDNDQTETASNEAWSFKGNGTLVTPGGQKGQYSGHLNCHFNTGTGGSYVCNAQISYH